MKFKPLNEYDQVPMTDEQSNIFFKLTVVEQAAKAAGESDPDVIATTEADFACKVVKKRFEVFGGKISPELLILISYLSGGNPGRALMYGHAAHMRTPVDGITDIEAFAHAFPIGFPSEEEFGKAWDASKQGAMNGVDDINQWSRA